MVLFGALLDSDASPLAGQLQGLQAALLQGLRDPAMAVRTAAVKVVASFVSWVEESNARLLVELLGPMVDYARAALAEGDEENAVLVFETVTDILEMPMSALQEAIPGLAGFACEAALNPNLQLSTREQALQLVPWLAQFKPKQLAKHGLIPR